MRRAPWWVGAAHGRIVAKDVSVLCTCTKESGDFGGITITRKLQHAHQLVDRCRVGDTASNRTMKPPIRVGTELFRPILDLWLVAHTHY